MMSASCYLVVGPAFCTCEIQYASGYPHGCPHFLWFNSCSIIQVYF